ncbi:thioredoxin-like protein [Geopyxis carbonaria]|nr:thioredoxin-like protein [Geopyxis carbonaria]
MAVPFRRKHLVLTIFLIFLFGIYYYNQQTQISHSSSYLQTLERVSRAEREQRALEADKMQSGLKAAEDTAKAAAKEKAGAKPNSPQEVQDALKTSGQLPDSVPVAAVGAANPAAVEPVKHDQDHTGEEFPIAMDFNAVEEIASILQMRTIVIFSKSYCPYSQKAKDILLEKYKINPPPYVIELDKHLHGVEMQAALKERTGRDTVPNVLINGQSIGGGDDVKKLDDEGKLVETIRTLGGRRILQIFMLKS